MSHGFPEIDLAPENIRRFSDLGFRVSFPGNMDPEMWSKVRPYRVLIDEVYASLHHDVFPAARVLAEKLNEEEHLQRLLGLGRELAPDGVALNVVLNIQPLPWSVDENKLWDQLERLMEVVEVRVSISDFMWAHMLRNRYPDLRIDTSVIAKVNSVFKAQYWQRHVGSDTIAVDRNINKKPHILQQLTDAGFTVKLVVSDGCMPSCPVEANHWVSTASSTREQLGARFFHTDAFCRFIKERLPLWHMLKKEVLPFHLPKYAGMVHVVKLCDRMATTEENLATLADYVRMKSDVHPRYRYREKLRSLDRLDRCDWNCHGCDWCARQMTPLVDDPPNALKEKEKEAISDVVGNLFDTIPRPETRIVSHAMTRFQDFDLDESWTQASEIIQENDNSQEVGEPEEEPRCEKSTSDAEADGLLASIRRAKTEAERDGDDAFPAFLSTAIQTFRPFLVGSRLLPSGHALKKLHRKSRQGLVLTWENEESDFEISLISATNGQPAAISGRSLAISFHIDEKTDETSRRAFRDNETFLADLIR